MKKEERAKGKKSYKGYWLELFIFVCIVALSIIIIINLL
jgi:hypothetical protein